MIHTNRSTVCMFKIDAEIRKNFLTCIAFAVQLHCKSPKTGRLLARMRSFFRRCGRVLQESAGFVCTEDLEKMVQLCFMDLLELCLGLPERFPNLGNNFKEVYHSPV